MEARVLTFRAQPAQREKLSVLAESLETTVSDVIRKLIDNAEIKEVRKVEPVGVLGFERSNDVKNFH